MFRFRVTFFKSDRNYGVRSTEFDGFDVPKRDKLGTFLNEKNIEKCGNAGCKEN